MKGRNRIVREGTIKEENIIGKKQAKDSTNKKELQKKRTQRYKTMAAFKKQRLLDKHLEKYKMMDTAKKRFIMRMQSNPR